MINCSANGLFEKLSLLDFELDIRPVSRNETREYAKRAMPKFFSGGELPPGIADVVEASCVSDVSRSYEMGS